ncbi:MAG: hypothetical protein L0Y44_03305 [Phycisphaerales bacterium]|nr:hypothetical protein [Phycisphaerales bacterium]MCI0629663.1 hypothetical protein [Phycisphaerales bacterium]MCI0674593.1 hypothetical protein [Phycisphaerales bacterium]
MRNQIILGTALLCCTSLITTIPTHAVGPDVVYSECTSISNHAPVGGIRAYTLGSHTCNIGNQNLLWINDGTPALAMNAYRLHGGRLVQIGMSWCKTACCAGAQQGCGLNCNGVGGNMLGAGCLDVYSSGWNEAQAALAPRSGINGYTGSMSPIPPVVGPTSITRRLQVPETEMSAANYPGAQYFVEGQYAASDDAAQDGPNAYNNASYKRVNVSAGFVMSLSGSMFDGVPAIQTWHDHGNGINNPDPTVQILNVDVPAEGRFITASKVVDNGNGTWRYEYAVFNLSSHRSGGSFTVPVHTAVNVTNIGFHDVLYHSGEPYDNTDWTNVVDSTGVTWHSPQTFAQNQNSNALRWGTMYNFWFDADQAPNSNASIIIGLFRPGDPTSISFNGPAPSAPCTDLNADSLVDVLDLLAVISVWGPCADPKNCPADIAPTGGDGTVDMADALAIIANWGPCQ